MDHKRKRHAKRGCPKIKENNWERRARQLREGMAKRGILERAPSPETTGPRVFFSPIPPMDGGGSPGQGSMTVSIIFINGQSEFGCARNHIPWMQPYIGRLLLAGLAENAAAARTQALARACPLASTSMKPSLRALFPGKVKWMPNPWMDPRGGRKEKMI